MRPEPYYGCECYRCQRHDPKLAAAQNTVEAISRFEIARSLPVRDYAAMLEISNAAAMRRMITWSGRHGLNTGEQHRALRDRGLVSMHHYGCRCYGPVLTLRGRAVLELMRSRAYAA